MKIKSVRLCNVSSYAGESYFDFGLDDKKSIILIGGQNGTGKTSLFTAIKIALYGHLCFNYQTASGQYMSKIKEIINHDAFTTNEVKAFVEVQIEVPNERDVQVYTIKREWEYNSQKLSEKIIVSNNEEELKSDELVFFQNYLFTILPPNLFDFFFFDGEQIADFFASNNYSGYIKKAVLTLCSVDTFETIRKFSENYISSNNSNIESAELLNKYNSLQEEINAIKIKILENNSNLSELDQSMVAVAEEKMKLAEDFRNSGGLSGDEKDKLLKKSKDLEKTKNEVNLKLRSIVEHRLPFIITKEFANNIKATLAKEDEWKKFIALEEKLNSVEIINTIDNVIDKHTVLKEKSNLINDIVNSILEKVKSDDYNEFSIIHDLSNEQQSKVYSTISAIESVSTENMLKLISDKEKATKATAKINKQLREAMADNDASKYIKETERLNMDEFNIQKDIEALNEANIMLEESLNELSKESEATRTLIISITKEKNIYILTEKVQKVMTKSINRLIQKKFQEIEKYMLAVLNSIMRKDNFIDLIELDSEFNIYTYKEQTYLIDEIKNLVKNISSDELAKRLGTVGVERLLAVFNIDSISKLKSVFKNENGQLSLIDIGDTISLYKKIEFNQLSKGEKQIFILSLYYAIIKVSRKDIPFIIDTPYARIDTEHREQISREFFPNISNQVVILSTDEEITPPYYNVLKPFISKEYLLTYNEVESKTTVCSGYFYKE